MKKLLLLVLFSLLGCSDNPLLGLLSPNSSSNKSPTECRATYTGYDGAYDLTKYEIFNGQLKVTINQPAVLKFQSNPGCTQKIEMAAFEYAAASWLDVNEKKPTALSNWEEITSSKNIYFLYPSTNKEQISLCIRATSNLGEESRWYCRVAYIKGYGGGSNPTPTPTPTATPTQTATTVSAPTDLRYYRYVSTEYSFYWSSSYQATDRYSVVDSYGNIILSLSTTSNSVSIPFSRLTSGKTYQFKVFSEISGVRSPTASVEFYIPANISVTLYWTIGDGYKYTYCKDTKSFLDIDFVTLKKGKYPNCILTSSGLDTYELNCGPAQNCSYYSCATIPGANNYYCSTWIP